MNKYNKMAISLALVAILLAVLVAPSWAQVPLTRMRNVAIQVLSVTAGLTADDITTTDDLVVGDDLTVVGDTAITGDTTFAGTLLFTPSTTQTVTMNDSITADSAVVLLTSAGTVNTSDVACGANGGRVTYINVGAQSIVLTDTGALVLSGNTTLAALDTLTLQSVWGNCIEVAQTDN